MKKKAIGDTVECPVCGKPFKVTVDSCCLIRGGYTCSWKCFLDEVKRREEQKKSNCK